ncbi:hypothetical protein BV898_14247 [Hypsibius exemplaris]|uniref:Uncharacterized protein n=1 Tax=Hypsibius exemplaris TaxID=2072580 RepID=A0A1W0W8C0_HYPEX|nr:hypothetical protein BV898_14247 [Hypsibius exemplaris]
MGFTVPLPQAKQTVMTAWLAITPTISFIGALNNALVLRLTWSSQLRRSAINLLIVYFAVLNLCQVLLLAPYKFSVGLVGDDVYGLPVCVHPVNPFFVQPGIPETSESLERQGSANTLPRQRERNNLATRRDSFLIAVI